MGALFLQRPLEDKIQNGLEEELSFRFPASPTFGRPQYGVATLRLISHFCLFRMKPTLSLGELSTKHYYTASEPSVSKHAPFLAPGLSGNLNWILTAKEVLNWKKSNLG